MTPRSHRPIGPTVAAGEVGWLTEAQMIEVDRIMIEDLHIELIQMMENAGRHLATAAIDLAAPSTATVLVGSGGNGGGGMVAARHLANRGVAVTVVLGKDRDRLGPVPAHQLDIVERMGLPVLAEPPAADVVIDALIGYRLRGGPRGRIAELIAAVPTIAPTAVALDTPSGLDVTDGSTPGVAVAADATVTLALPKVGLRHAAEVGELHVADISVPPWVYERIGAGPAPPFERGPILTIGR
ncbi:MAG: NAD(P)H-hydrate epimerase [Actinomycetota bacterium]